jgi:hypothetical protein
VGRAAVCVRASVRVCSPSRGVLSSSSNHSPHTVAQIPVQYRQATIDRLSATLPLNITAGLLDDDKYWMRSYEVDCNPQREREGRERERERERERGRERERERKRERGR